jgi:outer membrane receptor protein involved in Fe transport
MIRLEVGNMSAVRLSLRVLFTVSILLLLIASQLFGAAFGQIKGKITDKETGEGIPGVTIMILNTTQGAQTDFDGNFIIRGVEPGTYTLKISSVEYSTISVTDVVVKADLTFEVNQKLEKGVVELGKGIEVRADKDIIDKFVMSNSTTISKEAIKTQPVTTVNDLITQVAGVVQNKSGQVFIRGGRAGEVQYIVDGVPLNNTLGGLGAQVGANLSLVSGSIQEFTVIKDGFDPEYGDALSGIVKITTQTGEKDNTRFTAQFITDDFGNKSLNKYSRNNDFLRLSVSGPDPIFRDKILPALGLKFLQGKEFTYYLYGEVDKSNGAYQYDDYDTPTTKRVTSSFNLLGLDVPERLSNRYYWNANFKFRPRQDLKFIFSYKRSYQRGNFFDWTYRYSASTAPAYVSKWQSASLEVSQSLKKNLNYEAVLSFNDNEYDQAPGDPNRPGHGLDPDDFRFDYEWERYEDRNRNGQYDAPEPIINLFPDTTSIYGVNFTGPAYTSQELGLTEDNVQAGVSTPSNFRFNDNGYVDNLEGEPYVDLNGNGVWDQGDFLNDVNGNGILDASRVPNINNRNPEPYLDGDVMLGEPFEDLNQNGTYDPGIDLFIAQYQDLNHNGLYDGPDGRWSVGIPYIDRNGNGIFDFRNEQYDQGEQFTDINGNGRFDFGGSSTFFDPNTFDETSIWHHENIDTYRGELKLFWLLGKHELKAGGAIRLQDFLFEEIEKPYVAYTGRPDSIDGGAAPYQGRGAFRDMFAYKPWGGTVYFRDKLEYGSMIASLGARWDFFIQDRDRLVPVAENDDFGGGIIYGDRQAISPRIGFSYPISDKAKVYFNYGHFYQLPDLSQFYRRNTASVGLNVVQGNYNLNYQKTVQYSFGVKYAMTENYSIDFSGYFKDEFDKINRATVRVNNLQYQQYRNTDYGRSRGIEITLEKRGGGYVNGTVSYAYAFAFGKASEASRAFGTPFELSREPLSEAPLDNDVRHALKGSIQFFIPSTVKPRLFGIAIPNGWSLSVEALVESGRPYTPGRDHPGISQVVGVDIQRNSLRKPSIVNFDIRFNKDFKFVGMEYSFIAWVENVFDSRNVNSVYANTGRADTQQNRDGVIYGGTEFDSNPGNWDFGRQIRVGLEMNL